MGERGPDSAGIAIYRDPVASGHSKLCLFAAEPDYDWSALHAELSRRGRHAARAGGPREPRRVRPRSRRAGRAALAARPPSGVARHERRRGDRDLQGDGAAVAVRLALRALRAPGHARPRPHAHGDREPRHDDPLAPFLDRPRPLPRAQRVALEPQPPAHRAAPRRHRVRDRQRLRGGGRLPDLAPRAGRLDRGGARGLHRRARRLLHLRRGNTRRLRRAARPDRVQAGGPRRDRRLGRNGLGVPRDRGASRLRRRGRVGAGTRRGLQLAPGARRAPCRPA